MRTLIEAVKALDLSDFATTEEFTEFVQTVGNFFATLPPELQTISHFSVTAISEIGLMIQKDGNCFDAIFDPHDGIWVIWFATDRKINVTTSVCNRAHTPGLYDKFREAVLLVIGC